MTEPVYNMREVDLKFKNVDERFDSQDATLVRIEAQTTKTNGRLNKLEKFMWMIIGAMTIISFISASNVIGVHLNCTINCNASTITSTNSK